MLLSTNRLPTAFTKRPPAIPAPTAVLPIADPAVMPATAPICIAPVPKNTLPPPSNTPPAAAPATAAPPLTAFAIALLRYNFSICAFDNTPLNSGCSKLSILARLHRILALASSNCVGTAPRSLPRNSFSC